MTLEYDNASLQRTVFKEMESERGCLVDELEVGHGGSMLGSTEKVDTVLMRRLS